MKRAIASGVLTGILLAVLVARAGGPARPDDAAAAFLRVWERSLTSAYVLVERLERRLVSGRSFTSEVRIAQRPPDRVREAAGGIEARVGGRRFGCVPGGGCRDGGPAPPYRTEVAEEVALLRALVTGAGAAYAVRRGDGPGCFVLVLRARVLAPPYGEDATFCFDAATGARRSALIHRAEATDVHTTVSLRADVRPADLALPGSTRGGGLPGVEAE